MIKKVAGVDPKKRADYGKAHVIISEKRDKKAAKYLVKDLPFPYTSKAQFERSMDTPLGTEWNTRVGFQRGTLPKVTKKVRRVSSFIYPKSRDTNAMVDRFICVYIDGCRYFTFGEAVLAFNACIHTIRTAFVALHIHLRFQIGLNDHFQSTGSHSDEDWGYCPC